MFLKEKKHFCHIAMTKFCGRGGGGFDAPYCWYNYFLLGYYFESCRLVYHRPTIFLFAKFCDMDGLCWWNMRRKVVAQVKKRNGEGNFCRHSSSLYLQ